MRFLPLFAVAAQGACYHRLGWATPNAAEDRGQHHVILENGLLYAWGPNDHQTTGSLSALATVGRPLQTHNLYNVASVSTGAFHTCALQWNGTAYCWGTENGNGNLGVVAQNTPTLPLALPQGKILDITAGEDFTCVAKADYTVWCFGDNSAGSLGPGNTDPTTSPGAPVQVVGVANATGVVAGKKTACAWSAQGSLWCWGEGAAGDYSDASGTALLVPLEGVVGASVGVEHTCAWTSTGAGYCWGTDGGNFKLGGDGTDQTTAPVLLPEWLGFIVKISTGAQHTCALTSAGLLYCFGDNSLSQLGLGDWVNSAATLPPTIPTLLGVRDVQASAFSTCAITSADKLLCWGDAVDGLTNPTGSARDGTVAAPNEFTQAYFDCTAVAKGKGKAGGKAKKGKKVAGALIGGAVAGVALVGLAVRHRRKRNYTPIGTPAAVAV